MDPAAECLTDGKGCVIDKRGIAGDRQGNATDRLGARPYIRVLLWLMPGSLHGSSKALWLMYE